MNKQYAIKILEMVELSTLEHNCSLAKEAYRYLENLILKHRKINQEDDDILSRIYRARHKSQW